MPYYDYKCPVCEETKEVLQKHDDPAPRCCCDCDQQGPYDMERMISAPSVRFKGSGFYSTDYAPKPKGRDGRIHGKEKS